MPVAGAVATTLCAVSYADCERAGTPHKGVARLIARSESKGSVRVMRVFLDMVSILWVSSLFNNSGEQSCSFSRVGATQARKIFRIFCGAERKVDKAWKRRAQLRGDGKRGGYSCPSGPHVAPDLNYHYGVGRGCGVGRTLAGGMGLGVGVGGGVGVGVGVAVGVGVGVAVGVGVGVGVAVGVGVGVPPPPGAWISTFIGEPILKKPTVASVVFGA